MSQINRWDDGLDATDKAFVAALARKGSAKTLLLMDDQTVHRVLLYMRQEARQETATVVTLPREHSKEAVAA